MKITAGKPIWKAYCTLHGDHEISQREQPLFCRQFVLRRGVKCHCDRDLFDVQLVENNLRQSAQSADKNSGKKR
jgi:hypothetical protein